MTELDSSAPPRVVIAGGGVAALEALMALRDLAGDRVRLTLVAPESYFVYRPLAVAEPFCLGHAAHHPLRDIAEDFDADVVSGALAEVLPGERRLVLTEGGALAYDSLLIAVGARMEVPFRHGITFGADGAPEALSGLLADLEEGYARRVAFVVPNGVGWTLPLYELALMTASDVWAAGIDAVELTVVSPEARPLEIFGSEASAMVAELLAEARIQFVGSVSPEVIRNAVLVGDRKIDVDRTLMLPRPAGPAIPGLPDRDGFIPVDDHGRVDGVRDVYAAGDVTDGAIKQGGLAAQQALAAAETIAARYGADLDPEPFRPILRGMLLTGARERFLRGPAAGTPAATQTSMQALWWPPTEIATRYLAPYLMGREEADRLRASPPDARLVQRSFEPRHRV